jgi:hypothetical protein
MDHVTQDRLEIAAEAAEEARLGTSRHAASERFIPVSKYELIERLSSPGVWPGQDTSHVETFFKFLVHWRHLSYAELQNEMVWAYAPFSPDADVKLSASLTAAEKAERQKAFIGHVRNLLERANYEEISRESLDSLLSEQNPYGLELKVDLSEFEELAIFYRGLSETTFTPPSLERWVLRRKPITLPIYQRLFVLLKLKPFEARVREIMLQEQVDAKRAEKIVTRLRKTVPKSVTGDFIFLKLFKFIPRADLEMLFPNTRVQMRKLDKLRIGLTAGGGTTAGVVGTVTKLSAAAALTNPITVSIALAGLAGVVFRQVMTVFNTRTRYMAELSKNLYFHNLANNHGVLALLSERGEEEDIKEEVLLYTLLARTPVTRAELPDAKSAVEQYLKSEFDVTLSFDIHDALGRLERDGLVVEGKDGVLQALPPIEAAKHLDDMWDLYLDKIARMDLRRMSFGIGAAE